MSDSEPVTRALDAATLASAMRRDLKRLGTETFVDTARADRGLSRLQRLDVRDQGDCVMRARMAFMGKCVCEAMRSNFPN